MLYALKMMCECFKLLRKSKGQKLFSDSLALNLLKHIQNYSQLVIFLKKVEKTLF